MPYDFDGAPDHRAPDFGAPSAPPQDLEAIVTLLEVAALELTSEPGQLFTEEELISQAQQLAGDFELKVADAKIVLQTAAFLRKEKGTGKRFQLR